MSGRASAALRLANASTSETTRRRAVNDSETYAKKRLKIQDLPAAWDALGLARKTAGCCSARRHSTRKRCRRSAEPSKSRRMPALGAERPESLTHRGRTYFRWALAERSRDRLTDTKADLSKAQTDAAPPKWSRKRTTIWRRRSRPSTMARTTSKEVTSPTRKTEDAFHAAADKAEKKSGLQTGPRQRRLLRHRRGPRPHQGDEVAFRTAVGVPQRRRSPPAIKIKKPTCWPFSSKRSARRGRVAYIRGRAARCARTPDECDRDAQRSRRVRRRPQLESAAGPRRQDRDAHRTVRYLRAADRTGGNAPGCRRGMRLSGELGQ